MSQRAIVRWIPSGQVEQWRPTTLDQLGKYEEFLENALATSPELLGLESRRTNVRGPFAIFRQVSMQTPSGRTISPDLVLLAASGHVIVIEVKRYVNPELRDRAVIAQIIDYASSFAALNEEQCVQLFGSSNERTWTDCITTMFPIDPSPDELADVLLKRIQRGDLNLVIACDKVPSGLPDVVSGISSQRALGFELDVVEVTPYVRANFEDAEILLVPNTRLATEVVSRTAITVTYREGDARPSTNVQITSLEDVEANIKAAGRPDARMWSPDEVEEEFLTIGHPVTMKLLEFVKTHGADGQIVPPGKKQNASFGFYVKGTDEGVVKRLVIFNCVVNWNVVYIKLNSAEVIASADTIREFREKLRDAFGDHVDVQLKEVGVPLDILELHLTKFRDIMLWFKSQAEASLIS